MNCSFTHYFISSSHNTYLIQDQLSGRTSISCFSLALEKGNYRTFYRIQPDFTRIYRNLLDLFESDVLLSDNGHLGCRCLSIDLWSVTDNNNKFLTIHHPRNSRQQVNPPTCLNSDHLTSLLLLFTILVASLFACQ